MKTQLEEIQPDNDSSFHIMVNPRLNDFFFWHFHPEFELVFIDGASGTRHVGEHISRYEDSDLVFIGSNIPHLNFDYGVKTDYEKVVLHIQPNFLKEAFNNTPELLAIQQLFEKSQHGLAFTGASKKEVGERMKRLSILPKFQQFLEVLQLFQILANADDIEFLHPEPVENQHNKKEQERLKRIYQFIDDNFQRKIDIEEVSELSHLTIPAFCRYFKKMTRLTFTEFLGYYRINQAKKLLRLDKNVSETCFECGFESLSYFNRTFKKITGENPMSFKKRYQ